MSAYRFSDIGGAHPTAKVEARIRVGAPADADDAQGGPSDAAAVGGNGTRGGQEGQEGPAYADPIHARVVEPAYREVLYRSPNTTLHGHFMRFMKTNKQRDLKEIV